MSGRSTSASRTGIQSKFQHVSNMRLAAAHMHITLLSITAHSSKFDGN